MKNNIWKKELVLGIIVLFVGASIISSTVGIIEEKHNLTDAGTSSLNFNPRGDTLYVGGSGPNNYTKIQDAIDNASDGDTVFVYDDSSPYYENVEVDKSINLIGENRDMTIIDGGGIGNVVHISADGVNFTGFSIQNSSGINDTGITIASSYNSISGNSIVNNPNCGIYIGFSYHDNNIIGNIITNTNHGIIIHNSHENTITENTISNINYYSGINLDNATNNTVSGNTITNTYGSGIDFYSSSDNNSVFENIVTNGSGGGIILGYSSNNNLLYHNNLINNTQNAYDNGTNTWDNGYPSGGNYWDDYNGTDADGDGIGDTPCNISGGDNQDWYPLMEPYGMTKLAISIGGAGLFKILGIIKNIGNKTAFNVQWKITIDGGVILLGRESSGTLPKPLLPGEETIVNSKLVLGFGRIMITVSAWADNAPIITKTNPGILLLFFIMFK